ncbi:DUF4959 domain-containing protein [Butyricimonas sp. Marseille-P3923]|uniref:DUF4959 domain-containing protein n=1 Tax=Butyricimonas sp. Marseille-P3923 TaxID=1987504 RepID=UPI00159BD807|nr:DUF4959 domain-containing protein [Butyricimonas sp. Marseille-P3923]
MKNILLLLAFICGLFACKDDDGGQFEIVVDSDKLRLVPVEGGAILYYKFDDPEINLVKAVYESEFDGEITRMGNVASDSIVLSGFHKPHQGVKIKVSLLDRSYNESTPIEMTVDTKASSMYAVLDEHADNRQAFDVISYWDGFSISSDLTGNVEGTVIVSFIGINPFTKLQDTVQLDMFTLEQGKYRKSYSISDNQKEQLKDGKVTAVIKTLDHNAKVVRHRVYPDIVTMERVKLPNANFEFYDPFKKSIEIDLGGDDEIPSATTNKFGWKYLFDGDIKGTRRAKTYYEILKRANQFTFLTDVGAVPMEGEEQPFFVIDIKNETVIGEVRLYAMVNLFQGSQSNNFNMGAEDVYYGRLPSNFSIYGCCDYDPANGKTSGTWEKIGEFKQKGTRISDRWFADPDKVKMNPDMSYLVYYVPRTQSLVEVEALGPYFLSVPIEFTGKQYRYLKLEFHEVYDDVNGRVTFHEFEVYAKKE